jgi:hypothetical protein
MYTGKKGGGGEEKEKKKMIVKKKKIDIYIYIYNKEDFEMFFFCSRESAAVVWLPFGP